MNIKIIKLLFVVIFLIKITINVYERIENVNDSNKETLPMMEKQVETSEPVCCDQGKNVYLRKQAKNLEQEIFTKTLIDDSTIFSLAGKKAELVPVEGWSFSALNITLEDGTKKECELTNIFFTGILDFRWIDEERIVLEGHINPSLNVYIVYSLRENSFKEYYGLSFTWDNDYNKLYFIKTSPHWGSEPVPEKIIDEDENIYYETSKGEYLVNTLILDSTNEYLGFYVKTKEEKKNFGILNCKTMTVLYEEKDVNYDEFEILVEQIKICMY